jgi:hypothetical protein
VEPHPIAHAKRAGAEQHGAGDEIADGLLRREADDDGGDRASDRQRLQVKTGKPEGQQHAQTAGSASRIRKPTVPAAPGSSRFKSSGPMARPRFIANAQPRITRAITHPIRIGRSRPNSSSRYE